jgi:hypothetical protein
MVETCLVWWALAIYWGAQPPIAEKVSVLGILSWTLLIFMICAALFVGGLCCFHVYLATAGQKTYQLVRIERELRSGPRRSELPTAPTSLSSRERAILDEKESSVAGNLLAFWRGEVHDQYLYALPE